MRMSYYSPEADLVLLASDESLGHLYPSSTCQSPPSIMYSPPSHHLAHRMPTTIPRTESIYSQHHNYNAVMDSPYPPPHTLWSSQPSPILQPRPQPSYSYPPFSGMMSPSTLAHNSTLIPQSYSEPRTSRSHSASSSAGLCIPLFAASETSPPPLSRSLSPTSPDLRAYGFPNQNGTWSCAYPGCTSRAVFTRGCDLRKHHKRHTKSFFCRHSDCPQSSGGGFSSKKDLARHEAKHNPGVLCEWDGCDRVFSRVDNMRDHVKRIHLKASRKSSTASS